MKTAKGLPRYSNFPENLGLCHTSDRLVDPHTIERFNANFNANKESIVDRSTGTCRIFTKATGAPLDGELAKREAEERRAAASAGRKRLHRSVGIR